MWYTLHEASIWMQMCVRSRCVFWWANIELWNMWMRGNMLSAEPLWRLENKRWRSMLMFVRSVQQLWASPKRVGNNWGLYLIWLAILRVLSTQSSMWPHVWRIIWVRLGRWEVPIGGDRILRHHTWWAECYAPHRSSNSFDSCTYLVSNTG